jgi:hypothetical protein
MMAGGDTVTKRTDGAPRCGGDVDALTLAIPLPHTVVGGHSRSTPWFGLDPKKVFAHVEFRPWYDFCVGIQREASYGKNSA